jgi:hypothetical protein
MRLTNAPISVNVYLLLRALPPSPLIRMVNASWLDLVFQVGSNEITPRRERVFWEMTITGKQRKDPPTSAEPGSR